MIKITTIRKVEIEEEKLKQVLYGNLNMLFQKLENENSEINNSKLELKGRKNQGEKKEKKFIPEG